MAVVYLIRDWNDNFECAQSRKISGPLTWVATPCKHDGKSFRRIMLMEDGAEIYCAWILMVQVAGKCPTRGILADADGPLDTTDLAIKTGCRQEVFDRALKVLCDKKIGWVLVGEWEHGGIRLPTHDPTNQTQPTNQPTCSPPNGDHKVGRRAGGNSLDEAWEAVAQRLAAIGLVQWRKAIDEAKAAGCTPMHAGHLIDHADRYNFGPGAIAQRFAIASPTLGVNTGWPNTERPETREEKRVKSAAEKRAKRAAVDAEQRAWELCKAGMAAKKSRAELKAECEAANLPWVDPAIPYEPVEIRK